MHFRFAQLTLLIAAWLNSYEKARERVNILLAIPMLLCYNLKAVI